MTCELFVRLALAWLCRTLWINNYKTCVPMIVCFFFFAEVRSGRMSSYDPRSWGHLPKELFASYPSVKYGWRKPPGLRRLGADFPFGSFCRDCWHHVEITLEWNGCSLILMSAFRFILYGDTGWGYRHGHPFETLCYYSVNTNPRVTPAGSPATVTRALLLLLR